MWWGVFLGDICGVVSPPGGVVLPSCRFVCWGLLFVMSLVVVCVVSSISFCLACLS